MLCLALIPSSKQQQFSCRHRISLAAGQSSICGSKSMMEDVGNVGIALVCIFLISLRVFSQHVPGFCSPHHFGFTPTTMIAKKWRRNDHPANNSKHRRSDDFCSSESLSAASMICCA